MDIGVLSVMTTLISMMPMYSASSWGSLAPLQQKKAHFLDREVVVSGLIISAVLVLKPHHSTAHIMDLEFTTASIMKMLVFSAHVSHA